MIDALQGRHVRFVVVGGMAMVVHGATHVTVDSDIAIATDDANRQAVAKALAQLEPEPTRLPRGQKVVWDERSIRGAMVALRTTAGDVDVMLETPGLDSFDQLERRALTIDLAGRKVLVASIEDLIAMKRTAGREKDHAHIRELEALEQDL